MRITEYPVIEWERELPAGRGRDQPSGVAVRRRQQQDQPPRCGLLDARGQRDHPADQLPPELAAIPATKPGSRDLKAL